MPPTPGMTRSISDDVGREGRGAERRLPVGDLGDDLDVVLELEERASPWRTTAWSSAIRTRIIAGTSTHVVVPAPGAERSSASRPARRARSSIDVSPSRRERTRPRRGRSRRRRRRPRSAGRPRARERRRCGLRRRGAGRSPAPPARSGRPRAAPGAAAARHSARTRSPRVHPPQHLDVLAHALPAPRDSSDRRAQLEDHRAQLLHRLARQLAHALELARRRPGSRSSSVAADSAASATPNSFCVTESCSSRASRLRSSTIESSRERS